MEKDITFVASGIGMSLSLPTPHMMECAIHGVFERQYIDIQVLLPDGGRKRSEHSFCPFCWGEWMQAQFPVTETVEDSAKRHVVYDGCNAVVQQSHVDFPLR